MDFLSNGKLSLKPYPICSSCMNSLPEFLSFSYDDVKEKDVLQKKLKQSLSVSFQCSCQPKVQNISLIKYLDAINKFFSRKNLSRCCNHSLKTSEVFCINCHSCFCEECLLEHIIDKPSHKMSLFNYDLLISCSAHKKNTKYLCKTCSKEICKDCVNDHKEHEVVTLMNFYKDSRKNWEIVGESEVNELSVEVLKNIRKFYVKHFVKTPPIGFQLSVEPQVLEKIISENSKLQTFLCLLFNCMDLCGKSKNVNLIKSINNLKLIDLPSLKEKPKTREDIQNYFNRNLHLVLLKSSPEEKILVLKNDVPKTKKIKLGSIAASLAEINKKKKEDEKKKDEQKKLDEIKRLEEENKKLKEQIEQSSFLSNNSRSFIGGSQDANESNLLFSESNSLNISTSSNQRSMLSSITQSRRGLEYFVNQFNDSFDETRDTSMMSSNLSYLGRVGGNSNTEIMVHVTRTGSKYHKGHCRYLWKSDIPMPLSTAQKLYSPCSVCW